MVDDRREFASGSSTDRRTIARPSLVEAFAERARAVGAQVTLVPGVKEAAQIIATSGAPITTDLYTASSELIAEYSRLGAALQTHGIDLRVAEEISAGASPSEAAALLAGGVGIIRATAGVAETGSFLSADTGLAARLLGMLSDSVYALLPASSIVPTLDEMGLLLSQLSAQGNRYLSLVTGPSRTADIERVLTIGVQGPKMLYVLVLLAEPEGETESNNG